MSNIFTAQVNVDESGQNIIGDAANEPSIAVDQVDPNRITIGWRQFNTITSNFRQAGYGFTTNGGTNWSPQTSGTTDGLWGVSFTDANNGTAVGDNGTILKTQNGGTTWLIVPNIYTSHLISVYFVNSNTGWAVGENGTILKTTNGGTNWLLQSSGTTYWLDEVCFTDANNGAAVGENGTILKTTNGGTDWLPQSSGTTDGLYGVSFTDANNGTAVGDNGTILNTTDGGINWNSQTSGTVNNLFSVHFTDNNTGWAVGGFGCILKTIDGGLSWIKLTSGSSKDFYSVQFVDSETGWVVGEGGRILKTTNGGIPVELTSFTASTSKGKVFLNWTTATELNNLGFEIERKIITDREGDWVRIGFVEGHGTTTEIQNYQFIDNISKIRATSLSYRLKQIDFLGSYEYSDEVLVGNPAPLDFALQQNYPNPFNPVTIIRYSIPIKSQVEIVIYNTLGEKVIQLVNEKKDAGSYEITWNAEILSSGVYFYRLQAVPNGRQAGGFVETKKMVLMK